MHHSFLCFHIYDEQNKRSNKKKRKKIEENLGAATHKQRMQFLCIETRKKYICHILIFVISKSKRKVQVREKVHTLIPSEVAPGITSLPKSLAPGNLSRSRFNITSLLMTYIPILAMKGISLALLSSRPKMVVST